MKPASVVMLDLPLAPSVNALYANRTGGRNKTAIYKAWLTEAGYSLSRQHPGAVGGPYALTIHCVRPDKRRRDLGNLEKATSDLLKTHGIIEDDSLCQKLTMEWVKEGPPMHVMVCSTKEVA